MPPDRDEITTGELGRRIDEVRDDVRELLGKLDTKFVPRPELDERHRMIDLQYHGLESEVRANRAAIAEAKIAAAGAVNAAEAKAVAALETYRVDVTTARRWAVATFLTAGLMFAALVANIAVR